ncbi:MAG: UDP-N-acetylmuramate dehydrogenase, partial [bacterium]|nr:UDP-N-acetylmuramate dehydrogenase [bacterium]
AGAGVAWDRLVERTVAEGLGGLECLSGIPGRVGAAPIQNIGAYGQEVSETIVAVHAVERTTGEVRNIPDEACGFGYRHSRFKGRWRDRYAIVGVDFLLERRPEGAVRYPELRRRFEGRESTDPAPSPAEVREVVLDIRRGKSMVLDPADPNHRSAGSFFVNPTVTPEAAREVRERLEPPGSDPGNRMPAFPAAGGRVKLAAAWLIERAGFHRGYRLGKAAVSTRHALALVNTGGATAAEIVALASRIRRGVRDACGVPLEPEPVFLGFETGVGDLLD